MDLNEEAEQAISALLGTFQLTTTSEVLAFARQAWFRGYEAGMDVTRDRMNKAFELFEAAQSEARR